MLRAIQITTKTTTTTTLCVENTTKAKKKNTFVSCCPTDPNFLVPTLNFFRDF